MQALMTKQFSNWASKQNMLGNELAKALDEVQSGSFEANLSSLDLILAGTLLL